MILLDSSAWVTHLRGADVPALAEVRTILRERASEVVVCEPVVMELLAGATSGTVDRLERVLDGLPSLRFSPETDFRTAATLHRSARATGETVRSMVDCVIAAVAIRHGAQLVHRDRDFDVLAQVSPLDQVRLS
ncbi:PIN domain nuclease [Klenkia sp. LSe6-5]|uniref:Ribonuclease VapC n=1 Tax=Klenkia sesuvii TaxID=3103137 RepID=A0ABU8DP25_9ACTN